MAVGDSYHEASLIREPHRPLLPHTQAFNPVKVPEDRLFLNLERISA